MEGAIEGAIQFVAPDNIVIEILVSGHRLVAVVVVVVVVLAGLQRRRRAGRLGLTALHQAQLFRNSCDIGLRLGAVATTWWRPPPPRQPAAPPTAIAKERCE